jgi:hypothetical protein
MKAVLYFPLAYVANVHGFILLAPYLVLFLTVVRYLQLRNSRNEIQSAKPAPIPVTTVR